MGTNLTLILEFVPPRKRIMSEGYWLVTIKGISGLRDISRYLEISFNFQEKLRLPPHFWLPGASIT